VSGSAFERQLIAQADGLVDGIKQVIVPPPFGFRAARLRAAQCGAERLRVAAPRSEPL
jgi:hypothetical protein